MKSVSIILFGLICFQGFTQNYFDIVSITYTNTPSNNFQISKAQTKVEELALDLHIRPSAHLPTASAALCFPLKFYN